MPAYATLYTSVIPLNPEKCRSKESWATDMSPTTLFRLAAPPLHTAASLAVLSLVYPGCGTRVVPGWAGRGTIPVPTRTHPRDPYLPYSRVQGLPTAK